MIHDIEHLHAELQVEVLRDSLDAIVLEHGEVQIGYAGADNSVAASITAQIGAKREWEHGHASDGIIVRITIGIVEGKVWSGRDGETLRLNVIAGVSGIGKRAATDAAEPVWKSKIVVVLRTGRVVTRPPCWRKRHTVADRKDHAEFPSIGRSEERRVGKEC